MCNIIFRHDGYENCNVSMCSNFSLLIISQLDTDSVILRLGSQHLSPGEYCLVVTATNGSFTAILTGSFIVAGNMIEYHCKLSDVIEMSPIVSVIYR